MTNREAITILDQATAQLSCNREVQFRIIDALKVLLVLVDEKETADKAKKSE